MKLDTRTTALSAMLLTLVSVVPSSADYDERKIVGLPTSYPWNKAVKVGIGPLGGGRGSGVLVSPCTILTNGHVVYSYADHDWREIPSVAPGSYYDDALAKVVNPYGSQPQINLATNTGWVDTGNDKYDYGAIFVADPFPGLSVFMPLAFEYEAGYINLTGYPSEDLPESGTGKASEQWRGFGDIKTNYSRTVNYEATSTGGASGSQVWEYFPDTEDRFMVAINRGHTNSDNDGRGVRFVDQNYDLIVSWLEESCPGGLTVPVQSWDDLLGSRALSPGVPIVTHEPEQLGLVEPSHDAAANGKPAVRLVQWIAGQVYAWDEFELLLDDAKQSRNDAHGQGPKRLAQQRFVRLRKPEDRFLTAEEAAVLLSASMMSNRLSEPASPVLEEPPLERIYPILAPASSGEELQGPEVEVRRRQ